MGTGTLTTRSDNDLIPASDHNEILEALSIDLVPRNASNAAQDIIGSLGTSAYRWLYAYVQQYYIGNSANNLRIYEGASGEIWINNGQNEIIKLKNGELSFEIDGTERFKVDANGVYHRDTSDVSLQTVYKEDDVRALCGRGARIYTAELTTTWGSGEDGVFKNLYTTTVDGWAYLVYHRANNIGRAINGSIRASASDDSSPNLMEKSIPNPVFNQNTDLYTGIYVPAGASLQMQFELPGSGETIWSKVMFEPYLS